jgi:putative flippase GtrA
MQEQRPDSLQTVIEIEAVQSSAKGSQAPGGDSPVARRRFLLRQILRFGAVGAINTVVDLSVLNVLIVFTHTGRAGAMFALFKSIAFGCAVLNSYLMNRSWTFARIEQKSQVVEGVQFLFISVLGAFVNVGSSWYVATYVQPSWGIDPRWWPSFAALVGTAFSLGFNFFGYKFWVFSSVHHD